MSLLNIVENFAVTSICFSPDGERLATAGYSTTDLNIWQLGQNPQKIATLDLVDNQNPVNSISWSQNYLSAIANTAQEIFIFDQQFNKVKTLTKGISREILVNQFNHNGRELLVATRRPLNQTLKKQGLTAVPDIVIYTAPNWNSQAFESGFHIFGASWLSDLVVVAGNDRANEHQFSVVVFNPATGQQHKISLGAPTDEARLAVLEDKHKIGVTFKVNNDSDGTFESHFYVLHYNKDTGNFQVLHSAILSSPDQFVNVAFTSEYTILDTYINGQSRAESLDGLGNMQHEQTFQYPTTYGLATYDAITAIGTDHYVVFF